MAKTVFSSLFVSVMMLALLSIFIITPVLGNPVKLYAATGWTFFLVFGLFMMLKTGTTSRYRSLFFVLYAAAFVFTFITGLLDERGSMALTETMIQNRETPLCPVAIPQLILPLIFRQELIFPTKILGGPHGGFIPIFLLWLVSVAALGRGWCSWGCFFGGIDEGCAGVLRKPVIKSRNMNPKWLLVPFVVLLVIVIWSFLAMEPKYCEWLCPLKLVTEYVEINSLMRYLQAILFITLGMALLVVLPILMKKRTHCGLFCPLGAFQSLVGRANLYRVKIDPDQCVGCGVCRDVCPTFSIKKNGDGAYQVSGTCTRCGTCMDNCKQHAIRYTLPGCGAVKVPLSVRIRDRVTGLRGRLLAWPVRFFEEVFEARTLFIFTGVLFGGILSGSMVTDAVYRIYLLVTTGSVLTG